MIDWLDLYPAFPPTGVPKAANSNINAYNKTMLHQYQTLKHSKNCNSKCEL